MMNIIARDLKKPLIGFGKILLAVSTIYFLANSILNPTGTSQAKEEQALEQYETKALADQRLAELNAQLNSERIKLERETPGIMETPLVDMIFRVDPIYMADVAKIQPKPKAVKKTDLMCLAKNIYFEAGNQPEVGKIAVGVVTLNRTHDPRWKMSVCGVVEQRNTVTLQDQVQQVVCQFSWVCAEPKPIKGINWEDSMRVARMLLEGGYETYAPMMQGALFFHANSLRPGWKLTKVAVINDHTFYK